MKHLRYYREFKDTENATYRVELWQEAEEEYIPQEVMLAADPVVIEWGEVTKLDPVMGSGATLKLISMSDRQFVDLYTVEIGAIRMIVYRNDQLYWSGTIDTELYEEPYSQKDRYVTEVTFSDLGALAMACAAGAANAAVFPAARVTYEQIVALSDRSAESSAQAVQLGSALLGL
jgi:hypothetical protein